MEKDYDRIEWDFFMANINEIGLSTQMNSLVKQCVTTISYSLKVNGCTTD